MPLNKNDLDRWITGNWGEDQFQDDPEECENDTPPEVEEEVIATYPPEIVKEAVDQILNNKED